MNSLLLFDELNRRRERAEQRWGAVSLAWTANGTGNVVNFHYHRLSAVLA
jgi:hypothetical protein